MEWQPIETAPRDGTSVDLWMESGGRFANAAWDVVEYSEEMDGRDVMGWTDNQGHGSIEKLGPFTHWMPLPAPPSEHRKDE